MGIKISELPEQEAPSADAFLPIVQAGQTQKVQVQSLLLLAGSSDYTYDTLEFSMALNEGEETTIATIDPDDEVISFGAELAEELTITDFGPGGKRAVADLELWITDPLHSGVDESYYGPGYYGDQLDSEACILTQRLVRENGQWLLNTKPYDASIDSDAVPGITDVTIDDGESKTIKVTADHNGVFTFRVRVRVRAEVDLTPLLPFEAVAADGYIDFYTEQPFQSGSIPDFESWTLTETAATLESYGEMDPEDGWIGFICTGDAAGGKLSFNQVGDPLLGALPGGGKLANFTDLDIEAD